MKKTYSKPSAAIVEMQSEGCITTSLRMSDSATVTRPGIRSTRPSSFSFTESESEETE